MRASPRSSRSGASICAGRTSIWCCPRRCRRWACTARPRRARANKCCLRGAGEADGVNAAAIERRWCLRGARSAALASPRLTCGLVAEPRHGVQIDEEVGEPAGCREVVEHVPDAVRVALPRRKLTTRGVFGSHLSRRGRSRDPHHRLLEVVRGALRHGARHAESLDKVLAPSLFRASPFAVTKPCWTGVQRSNARLWGRLSTGSANWLAKPRAELVTLSTRVNAGERPMRQKADLDELIYDQN